MITPKDLAGAFARTLQTVKTQTEGLSNADCLIQPPFHSNCMNWTLGHIVDSRNDVLQLLGEQPILTEAQAKRYGYGSEPVCEDGEDILTLDKILELMERSQRTIAAALSQITAEKLAEPTQSFLGTTTLGFRLFFMFYHETLHAGQTELLRELALANR